MFGILPLNLTIEQNPFLERFVFANYSIAFAFLVLFLQMENIYESILYPIRIN